MLLTLEGDGPLYMQVYEALYRAIRDGRLKAGKRLPGTRTLARDLGISRTVVLLAYAQLDSEGITSSTMGKGTYVCAFSTKSPVVIADNVSVIAEGPPLSIDMPLSRSARLALAALPATTPARGNGVAAGHQISLANVTTVQDERGFRLWRRVLIETVNARSASRLDISGPDILRSALVDYLRDERGVFVEPDNVVIVNGMQQARDMIARMLVDPGTVVGIGDPGYRGIPSAFLALDATVVPCAMDDDGFDIERHASVLDDARIVYVMPAHHFPTGAVMTHARRLALLEWTYRHSAYIVEDDFDAEHRLGVRTAPPLYTMDSHERVIYIGSFARMYFPFMQLAYVIVPSPLREYFRAFKWLADRGTADLIQRALAHYIASGDYIRNLRRLGGPLARRRQLLVNALTRYMGQNVRFQSVNDSGNLFVHLPAIPADETQAFLDAALQRGLRLQSADYFHLVPCPHLTLLLWYASVKEGEIEEAVRRLAQTFQAMRH